ncbi:MAG: LamG-like jellyroll fold domain-containing protein [Marinicellaceae bacterium]
MKNIKYKNNLLILLLILAFGVHSQGVELIADYPLIDDLEDDTGKQTDSFLLGDPAPAPPGNGVELCQDGVWDNKNGNLATQRLRTPKLRVFDINNFEVEIEFKPTAFSLPNDVSPFKAVIMGGHLARWIGILIDNTGRVGFKFNNFNTNITWTNTVLTLDGLYHHGLITYDNGQAEMYIDQQLVHSQELPELITFQDDLGFITADNSSGSPFYGCVRNLKVRSTPDEVFKSSFE